MRAGDADREAMLERLRTAHAEGRLDAVEFEERVTAALAARTYGELAELSADLPGGPPAARPLGAPPPGPAQEPANPPARRELSAADLRRGTVAWGWVSLIAVTLWAVGSIASGSLIVPWWIWVVGPWGLGMLWSWQQLRRQRGQDD
ncbi:hypothetical protein BJF78_04490 [Pseudonocardia sp. CNS-139]|nr:hypothetical protein BJF78_04490 [Pseudonocardia sp. CNS-139]